MKNCRLLRPQKTPQPKQSDGVGKPAHAHVRNGHAEPLDLIGSAAAIIEAGDGKLEACSIQMPQALEEPHFGASHGQSGDEADHLRPRVRLQNPFSENHAETYRSDNGSFRQQVGSFILLKTHRQHGRTSAAGTTLAIALPPKCTLYMCRRWEPCRYPSSDRRP